MRSSTPSGFDFFAPDVNSHRDDRDGERADDEIERVLVQRILLIRPLADRSMHARNHHPT